MRWGLPWRARASAWRIISAQVVGGWGTRSLRYHSSWVLLLNGAATSWPFQVAVSRAALTASRSTCRRRSPVQGTIQPASANSASHTTSRPRMSSELSSAELRRTSCSRWSSAPDGRSWMAMVYSPFDAAEHSAAAAWKLPDGSGKMYQFSAGALVAGTATSCQHEHGGERQDQPATPSPGTPGAGIGTRALTSPPEAWRRLGRHHEDRHRSGERPGPPVRTVPLI